MPNSFSILFYPKSTKTDTDKFASLYVRITINGKRGEMSLKRKVEVSKWNAKGNRLKGTSEEVRTFNKYLQDVRTRLHGIHDKLAKEGRYISPTVIKDLYTGKMSKQYMVLEIFEHHNMEIESLVGKGYSKGTLQRYKAAKKHLSEYIAHSYKSDDLPITRADHKFISGLEYFLKSNQNCSHNTTTKYIVNFKKIIRIAYANQWIDRDPFFHWKTTWKVQERGFLTEQELQSIIDKRFKIARLEQVKDIFLFCCYTGLAYADIKKLTYNDIVIGINGERWIKTARKKTNTLSSIPILPVAESILEKYAEHPYVQSGKGVLPVLTNQKSNAYLKEIADLCGIQKNLTTHLARHTFATTVTLSNGVPIETVSKMLGHTSLKTTQHYAKILDHRIGEDMMRLKNRLEGKSFIKKKVENSSCKEEDSGFS